MASSTSAFLAASHYLALGVGLGALFVRGMQLRHLSHHAKESRALKTLLMADTYWGLAALLWIATGLTRAFGGYEKGTDYYLASSWFWLKMTLFGAVFLIEVLPMITFIRWRMTLAGGRTPEVRTPQMKLFFAINTTEMVLILAIPFVASLMARGI